MARYPAPDCANFLSGRPDRFTHSKKWSRTNRWTMPQWLLYNFYLFQFDDITSTLFARNRFTGFRWRVGSWGPPGKLLNFTNDHRLFIVAAVFRLKLLYNQSINQSNVFHSSYSIYHTCNINNCGIDINWGKKYVEKFWFFQPYRQLLKKWLIFYGWCRH